MICGPPFAMAYSDGVWFGAFDEGSHTVTSLDRISMTDGGDLPSLGEKGGVAFLDTWLDYEDMYFRAVTSRHDDPGMTLGLLFCYHVSWRSVRRSEHQT